MLVSVRTPLSAAPASASTSAPTPASTPDLRSADTARHALAVFFRIADRWGLSSTERQTLLGVSRTVFYRWQRQDTDAALDAAVTERLSYLFRIYAALQVLLPQAPRADAWLRQANSAPLFGGQNALTRMLAGQTGDLKDVADYLDAQRGGDFA